MAGEFLAIAVSVTNRYRKTPFDRSFFQQRMFQACPPLFARISTEYSATIWMRTARQSG
jgi:hypothetical protein